MYRSIKWVEETLIKEGTFSLSGRKKLLKSDTEYEIILIDATETPIERPKKHGKSMISGCLKNLKYIQGKYQLLKQIQDIQIRLFPKTL